MPREQRSELTATVGVTKEKTRMWFVGRVGVSVRWTRSGWWITQEKTGDRHIQLASLTTIHRKDEPTLVNVTMGPITLTIGDVLGKPNA